jgi:hypothetical protein
MLEKYPTAAPSITPCFKNMHPRYTRGAISTLKKMTFKLIGTLSEI